MHRHVVGDLVGRAFLAHCLDQDQSRGLVDAVDARPHLALVVTAGAYVLASLGIAVLIALTFAPIHVLHPLRVVRLRWLTLWLMAIGAVLAIYTLACDFNVGVPIVAGLCAIGLYVVGSDAVIRRMKSFSA